MPTLPQHNDQQRIPLHIITGFLGSGKTTLLNRLLNQTAMQQTAVIVNEFGKAGLDHLLIEAVEEDLMLLEGGCLCCSVRSDLVTTLEKLYRRREQNINPFNQVIIETTGLADPAPILRTLLDDSFVAQYFRLDAIVTTVDALFGEQQLKAHDESAKQAALATQLVLSKTDLIDDKAQIEALKIRLHRLNPVATLHLDAQKVRAETLFHTGFYKKNQLDVEQWLQSNRYAMMTPSHATPHHHDDYIQSFCIEHIEPLSWQTLNHWFKQLTHLRGKDLLRTKGIAYTQETDLPVVVQGVQHIFQPPTTLSQWHGEKKTQIVFITRNLSQQTITQTLHALIGSRNVVEVCQAATILLGEAHHVKK